MKVKVSELKPKDRIRAYGGELLKPIFVYEVLGLSEEPAPYNKNVYYLKLRLITKKGRTPRKEVIIDKPVQLDQLVERIDDY